VDVSIGEATHKPRRQVDPRLGSQPDATAVTHDDIAIRAYERYLARGGQNGSDIDDWLCAERELTTQGATRPYES
jgi:hypothetical protein